MAVEKDKPRYEVPGYAGYVNGIKPENLHAKTFGKLTYDVSNTDYLRGQDHPVEHRYVSTIAETHIPPSLMLQRTAADIVGVPPKKIDVNEVRLLLMQPNDVEGKRSGPEVDQFTQTKGWEKTSSKSLNKSNGYQQTNVVDKDGKSYGTSIANIVKLGEPLPGYTGFSNRVLANNIFGKTYAECRKDAKHDQHHVDDHRQRNYHNQLSSQPPIRH